MTVQETEQQKIERLMMPRIIVTAPMPGLDYSIGDVILPHPVHGFDIFPYPDKYPHLFKRLEWWADRKIEDMPKYLKHKLKDQDFTFHKIIKWDLERLFAFENENRGCDLLLWSAKYNYLPATESDYLAYNSTHP